MYDVFIKWNETMNQKRKKKTGTSLPIGLQRYAQKQLIDGEKVLVMSR